MSILAIRYLLAAAVVLSAGVAVAQDAMRLRTNDGREVILSPNGTWQYAPDTGGASAVAPNKAGGGKIIKRPANATAAIVTKRGNFVVWYDPNKWQQTPGESEGRVQLQLIGEDGYALILAEGLGIPTASLKNIALANARRAAPDARIVLEENRKLGDKEVVLLQMKGTTQSIPFVYHGHYYGDNGGAIQVLTYTGENLLPKYLATFEELINGLEIKR